MSSILPNAQRINEAEALVDGVDASCGPTASYIAAGVVNDIPLTQSGLQLLVNDAMRAGTLDTGGQNFGTGPKWDLEQYGISSTVTSPANATQLETTLNNALSQNKPAVLGLANANQLTGEPRGLQGHFVTAVGTDGTGGYVISDPNLGEFTNNSLGQLFTAQPVAITVPDKGGFGIPNNVIPGATGLPTAFNVQLPDISTGVSTGFEKVIADVFPFTKQQNWLNHFFMRMGFGILGGLIFIVSLDYFIGSFAPTQINQGPLQKTLRAGVRKGQEAEQAFRDKATEVAETAVVA